MDDIFGNNFLISIAATASSPTKAANAAQLAGCSPAQIRAVRNAAKFRRDKGSEAFDKQYSPYELVDVDIKVYKRMNLTCSIERLYESRGLNGAEFNELADLIEQATAGTKFKIRIKRQQHKGHVKA